MQSSIIAKLLSVLTIISEARRPLGFSELVTKSGLNKSTLHRLLAIATEENLVQFDKLRKVYLIGPKIFDLVRSAYSGYDIQAVALDEMLHLHGMFDGNVTIGIPSGMEVVYLRILDASSTLNPSQRPGMREPVHCSASGKALLAFLPDKVIAKKLEGYNFEPLTKRTITNTKIFMAALEGVRDVGFAVNDREEYDHLGGISAPIFNYIGEPIAVLNIWCVQTQHDISEMSGWSGELVAAADRITALIGGIKPDVDVLRAS
jgi:DNA-binding IclR family transcriptional regulator